MKGAIVVCLFALAFAAAQEFRATLTGRVVDSTDAAVPGVTVQAKTCGSRKLRCDGV